MFERRGDIGKSGLKRTSPMSAVAKWKRCDERRVHPKESLETRTHGAYGSGRRVNSQCLGIPWLSFENAGPGGLRPSESLAPVWSSLKSQDPGRVGPRTLLVLWQPHFHMSELI